MINYADVVVGISYGDEGKGKISALLAQSKEYNLVARWAGGSNAGHTIYVDGKKYKTHIIPSGVFYGIPSLIGPGCVLHVSDFMSEIDYLEKNGFDSSLVKVHPNCHIVQEEHILLDKQNLAQKLGTTSKGIAYAYADKAARKGILARDVFDKSYLWNSELSGNILCEGAQGVWLDIDHGNYPYVTSSITLPYGACSIGFPVQKIRNIYGCAKIYDTRSGQDPAFPDTLLENPVLSQLGEIGQEYGVTTGRRRKVNWLNLPRLIDGINLAGATHLIINKCDILEELGIFRLISMSGVVQDFQKLEDMKNFINVFVKKHCPLVKEIKYSYSPEKI